MITNQIATLIELRDQAHITHWATTSYAEHKALGSFYDKLTDLIDTFVETYQGKYGRLVIGGLAQMQERDSLVIVNEAHQSAEFIETLIDRTCTDLLNILADIKGLCNHTKYKLSLK
jgi:DNA-binding ferritin-like protein